MFRSSMFQYLNKNAMLKSSEASSSPVNQWHHESWQPHLCFYFSLKLPVTLCCFQGMNRPTGAQNPTNMLWWEPTVLNGLWTLFAHFFFHETLWLMLEFLLTFEWQTVFCHCLVNLCPISMARWSCTAFPKGAQTNHRMAKGRPPFTMKSLEWLKKKIIPNYGRASSDLEILCRCPTPLRKGQKARPTWLRALGYFCRW